MLAGVHNIFLTVAWTRTKYVVKVFPAAKTVLHYYNQEHILPDSGRAQLFLGKISQL
jgi:hypothetical protein